MIKKVGKLPQTLPYKEQGSSLIGIAILTLALGFLVTGGIFLMQNYAVIKSDQVSVDNFKAIQAGLKEFIAREKRFPCPAALNIAPDQRAGGVEFGKEISTNCSTAANTPGTFVALGRNGERVRIGAVPTRSLNLSDKQMLDGYRKRIFYAITESLATPGTDAKNDLGSITIINEQGHSLSDAAGHVVYALISPGADDRGSYNIEGNLIAPCEVGTDAGNNCDFTTTGTADATFVSSSVKSFGVGSTSFTHDFAFHSNAIPYKWDTGPWDECGDRFKHDLTIEVCFSGTQYRDVSCEGHKGGLGDVPVGTGEGQDENVTRCGHTPKPTSSRVCSLPPCYWNANNWATCTAGTGIGVSSITTISETSNNNNNGNVDANGFVNTR